MIKWTYAQVAVLVLLVPAFQAAPANDKNGLFDGLMDDQGLGQQKGSDADREVMVSQTNSILLLFLFKNSTFIFGGF